jgi:CheY-like chemotaxis protein
LRLAAEKRYDVIFTDVQMPEMDGFTFCTELRAGGSNRNTPVVFITSLNSIAAQAQALESGGNDFIGKPFLPIEITVKAMTFAWEGRLRELNAAATRGAASLSAPPSAGRTMASSSSAGPPVAAIQA